MANPNQPPARQGNHLPQLTDETLRELLAVQKQELVLRAKEVERDHAEINHNQSVAKQSIEAQERDRKHEREEQTKRQKTHQNFLLLAIVLALAFAAYCLYTGQAVLVLDLVKVVFGFLGGMGYWAVRQNKHNPSDR